MNLAGTAEACGSGGAVVDGGLDCNGVVLAAGAGGAVVCDGEGEVGTGLEDGNP